jgi:hypothetical protein
MHIGNTNVNPIQSVEVPYSSRSRFTPTLLETNSGDVDQGPSWEFGTIVPGDADRLEEVFIRTYVSAGEDMNFFFFNGMPAFYYYIEFTRDTGV